MGSITPHALLIDLQTYHSSALAYLTASALFTSASSSLRRRPRHRLSATGGAALFPASRPRDRFSNAPPAAPAPAAESTSAAASELDAFLGLVPPRMRDPLVRHGEIGALIELVMDLGRKPIARFPSGDWAISEQPVKLEDLRHAISMVGEFSDDNRSGINNSLHRISAIRNRKMQIIGLTCRVGRAVSGSAEMIRDLVEGGGSILVIGPPGVGKTTLIREIARVLADERTKRVVIVDTSNEIGGDGDVPHSGIGGARRMQVPNVHMQHNVMIEAVENHMPETIIIDEIGTELEAMAASTIAQRGVQLVGTAHGVTIESIIKNPSLQILVGGIESVTLGDEEARKRKVQKTILERKGPPTFTCAVEMVSKTECRVHHRLDATVDAILAGKSPMFEIRRIDEKFEDSSYIASTGKYDQNVTLSNLNAGVDFDKEDSVDLVNQPVAKRSINKSSSKKIAPVKVYTYKVLEADLLQVAQVMGLEDVIDVTDDINAATAVLASGSELKQNPWIRSVAKFHNIPVFVIKTNTMAQLVKAVRMILKMDTLESARGGLSGYSGRDFEIEDDAPKRKPSLEEIDALEEVRLAIEYIVIPGGEPVELLPRRSDIMARQIELVESYHLSAENSGTETQPRLQILPRKSSRMSSPYKYFKHQATVSQTGMAGDVTVARLPLLPE